MKAGRWFARFLSPEGFSISRTSSAGAAGHQIRIALVVIPIPVNRPVFNALTGGRQRVGNWPGVTVEKKTGHFVMRETSVEVVDLPGIYSLMWVDEAASVDERIACEFLYANRGALDWVSTSSMPPISSGICISPCSCWKWVCQ